MAKNIHLMFNIPSFQQGQTAESVNPKKEIPIRTTRPRSGKLSPLEGEGVLIMFDAGLTINRICTKTGHSYQKVKSFIESRRRGSRVWNSAGL